VSQPCDFEGGDVMRHSQGILVPIILVQVILVVLPRGNTTRAVFPAIKRPFDRGAVSQLRDSEGGGVMRHSVFPFRMREVTRSVFAFSNPRYWPQAELKLRRRRAVTP